METEKRLIDAYKLEALVRRNRASYHNKDDVIAAIAGQPTVDAVEVVRCKDCKYLVQGEPYDLCECMKWMVKFGVAYTTPDGYCHKAERKDENP